MQVVLNTIADAPHLSQHLRKTEYMQKMFDCDDPSSDEKTCKVCAFYLFKQFKQCSKCKAVVYCSRDCQVMDWPTHKSACKEFRHKKQAMVEEYLASSFDELASLTFINPQICPTVLRLGQTTEFDDEAEMMLQKPEPAIAESMKLTSFDTEWVLILLSKDIKILPCYDSWEGE
jgi:hypothetical protein